MACHYESHKAYVAACGGWKSEELKHSATLAKLCDATHGDAAPIKAAIARVCRADLEPGP